MIENEKIEQVVGNNLFVVEEEGKQKLINSKGTIILEEGFDEIKQILKDSKGIILSHLQAEVPYGKSHKIISTLPSGISFIYCRQSPSNNLLITLLISKFSALAFFIVILSPCILYY